MARHGLMSSQDLWTGKGQQKWTKFYFIFIFFRMNFMTFTPIRGLESFLLSDTCFLSANLSNEACMLYCWNRNKRGVIFSLRCTILKYSLDNVSNIYFTKCLYHLLKIQMSNLSEYDKISALLP